MSKRKQGTYPLKISLTKYPNFSDRLKIAMDVRNCSIDELAKTSFLTKATIYGYRCGTRSPNVDTLRIIAKNLDVSADFLIGLKEDIYI